MTKPVSPATFKRIVTVLPRRIAGGGLIRFTLTRNVPVTGSARGETSRTRAAAVTFWSMVNATVIAWFASTLSFACDLDDHATGADHLAGLGSLHRHDAGHVGDQPRVAQTVFRKRDLRLRRLHLRLGSLLQRLGLLVGGLRYRFLDDELTHSIVIRSRLHELRPRRRQRRSCGLQRGVLV